MQTDAPRSAQLGTVQVLVDDQSYDIALDQMSRGSLTLTDLNRGTYTLTAEYAGSDLVAMATSKPRTLTVRSPGRRRARAAASVSRRILRRVCVRADAQHCLTYLRNAPIRTAVSALRSPANCPTHRNSEPFPLWNETTSHPYRIGHQREFFL